MSAGYGGAAGVVEEALTGSDKLIEDGYLVVRRVLSPDLCDALREHVLLTTEEASKQKRLDLFGNIQEADNRWDLKLDLCKPVCEALNKFGEHCGETLRKASAHDTELTAHDVKVVECAAITSAGGAVAQPVHADTMHGITRFLQSDIAMPVTEQDCDDEDDDIGKIVRAVATDTAMIFTALIALQDVTADMGPTHVWPKTNTVEHHATLWGTNISGKLSVTEADKAFGINHSKMNLTKGDLVLYDSRTMHCGGANSSDKKRSVMCLSVMGPGIRPDGTTWSMLKSLRNRLRLSDLPLDADKVEATTASAGSEIVLPPVPELAPKAGSDAAAFAGDNEPRPVPDLEQWEAAVQCTTCRRWRPCGADQAPKLTSRDNGFSCPDIGFSCMQEQRYTMEEIDAVF